jgi:hypothetical protein
MNRDFRVLFVNACQRFTIHYSHTFFLRHDMSLRIGTRLVAACCFAGALFALADIDPLLPGVSHRVIWLPRPHNSGDIS